MVRPGLWSSQGLGFRSGARVELSARRAQKAEHAQSAFAWQLPNRISEAGRNPAGLASRGGGGSVPALCLKAEKEREATSPAGTPGQASHLLNTLRILWRTPDEEGAEMPPLPSAAPLPSGGRFSIVATTWLGCCCWWWCCGGGGGGCCSGEIIAARLAIRRRQQQGASCAARLPGRGSRGRSAGGGCGGWRASPPGGSTAPAARRLSAQPWSRGADSAW